MPVIWIREDCLPKQDEKKTSKTKAAKEVEVVPVTSETDSNANKENES